MSGIAGASSVLPMMLVSETVNTSASSLRCSTVAPRTAAG